MIFRTDEGLISAGIPGEPDNEDSRLFWFDLHPEGAGMEALLWEK